MNRRTFLGLLCAGIAVSGLARPERPRIEMVMTTRDIYENGIVVDEEILSQKILLYEGDKPREISISEYQSIMANHS
jgi:hypothetical protein